MAKPCAVRARVFCLRRHGIRERQICAELRLFSAAQPSPSELRSNGVVVNTFVCGVAQTRIRIRFVVVVGINAV